MSAKTTYTCDRCNKIQKNSDGLWSVVLYAKNGCGISIYERTDSPRRRQDWCLDCVNAFQLLPPDFREVKKPNAPPPPTLEDVIRELIRGEIANQ